jgi:hypothetical protein
MRAAMLVGLLGLSACDGGREWYEHPCGNGDPVGIECVDEADTVLEDPSVALCSDLGVSAGDVCEGEQDDLCVLTQAFSCTSSPGSRSSEAFLHCRSGEFSEEDTYCPESRREVKESIRYLDASEHGAVADQVLDVKLARYRYRDPAKDPGDKLGFILDDLPDAAFSGTERVDLYAYVSAVVALDQRQQAEIEALKARIEALEAKP